MKIEQLAGGVKCYFSEYEIVLCIMCVVITASLDYVSTQRNQHSSSLRKFLKSGNIKNIDVTEIQAKKFNENLNL